MFTSKAFLYLATVLPPIILGILIWKSDKFPEPGKFLVTAFMLGVAIDLPLHFLIIFSEDHLAPLLGLDVDAYYNWKQGDAFPAGESAFLNFSPHTFAILGEFSPITFEEFNLSIPNVL